MEFEKSRSLSFVDYSGSNAAEPTSDYRPRAKSSHARPLITTLVNVNEFHGSISGICILQIPARDRQIV